VKTMKNIFYNHTRAACIVGLALMLFSCGLISTEIIYRQNRDADFSSAPPAASAKNSILSTVVGELEGLIGDILVLKADVYFHGMSSYTQYLNRHSDCHLDHDHEHHQHEHEDGFNHFLYNKYRKICPTEHVHLDDDKEILPWLAASMRLNPHNIRAYIISSYWVGQRLKKWDQAEKIFHEGIRYNPKTWQLYYELGKLYAIKEEYQSALVQYNNALKVFPEKMSEEDAFDCANLWRSVGGSHEKLGDYINAVAAYQKVVKLNPCEKSLEKLQKLVHKKETTINNQ
jgi:tetratricopeptide (TPR) repeat protein